MTKYAGPTGNEPGRPRPEPIDEAIARILADQQGLPVEATRRGRPQAMATRGRTALRGSGRSVTSQRWFWPTARWVVIVTTFLLLARCVTSLDLTNGV